MNTCRPVGRWVALQADSILFTDCPPGPLDFANWYLTSFRSSSKLKGTTGITTIDIVLECSRPFDSVQGTLMTLCTPASHLIILSASSPTTLMSSDLQPREVPTSLTADTFEHRQPIIPQKDSYMLLISSTNIELSLPPAPGLNSSMISLALSQGASGSSSPQHYSCNSVSFYFTAPSSCLRIYCYYLSLVYAIISCRSRRFCPRDEISS